MSSGTPTAARALSICAAASGLRNGSMSEEFSGHTTRVRSTGARVASFSVPVTWLSSTARRWALNSSPAWGTLPCTNPTSTGRPSVGSEMASGARAASASAAAARPAAGSHDRRAAEVTAASSSVPTAATANVTPGAPSQRATCANGLSAWLNASRAQGNPP